MLGRAIDAAGIAYWQEDLAGGRSIGDVRANMAGSDEAGQAVGALYEAVLGRDGDAPGIAYWQDDLARSLSLDDVRTHLASSDEGGQAVGALYEAVLGRDGDAPGIAYWQQRIVDGADLDDIRQALAASSEVAADLRSATLVATGAPLGPDALAGYVARLSAGTADLDGLRSEIAAPAETLARVAIDFTTLGADSTLVFVPSTQSATLVATAEPETFVVAGLQAPVVIQDFDPAKDALQFSAAQFTDAAAVRAAFAMTLAGARLASPQGGTLLLAGQSDVSTLAIRIP